MKNTIKMQRLLTIGLLSATVLAIPLNNARAEDEHEHEHEHHSICQDCGVVTAVQAQQQSSNGLTGAAAGAVAGGVLGHQAGQTQAASSTLGGMATTLLGMAGGAIGGHYAEKAITASKGWTVTLKMGGGDTRAISMTTEPKVKVGDHVRVKGNSVEIYHEDD